MYSLVLAWLPQTEEFGSVFNMVPVMDLHTEVKMILLTSCTSENMHV